MDIALHLARKGAGKVNPNPLVGAVIVNDGKIIGKGYHESYGKAHAEINAFKDANEVICKSSIVSIKNGYKFEENKEYFVSNGENIFNLKRCSLK